MPDPPRRPAYQDYVNEVAQHAMKDEEMHAAVMRSVASSEKAIYNLAESDEAMARLAQSDKAMAKLARSDEAIAHLAKSDEAMAKLAQSDEATTKILGPEMFQIWKAHRSKPVE